MIRFIEFKDPDDDPVFIRPDAVEGVDLAIRDDENDDEIYTTIHTAGTDFFIADKTPAEVVRELERAL
jgi:hypothetical protein